MLVGTLHDIICEHDERRASRAIRKISKDRDSLIMVIVEFLLGIIDAAGLALRRTDEPKSRGQSGILSHRLNVKAKSSAQLVT